MARRAVFLDRDGVLIRDVDLLTRCEQIELYACVPRAIRRLREAGFAVVVVSNQTVVARGLASEKDVELVHAWIQQLLCMSGGGEIDRFYFCPHHPNATLPQYRVECDCRKPRPGMLLQAAQEMNLDLGASYMVGDRISDIVAGQLAGCRTILVRTGMHTAPSIETTDTLEMTTEPDFGCANLGEAVEIILRTMR
jgi:D-glycero-D-manno-heptose 1,7-bisphosphate phosphatase